MIVHYAGQSCDMDPILDIARKYKLIVIEDSAETIGGETVVNKEFDQLFLDLPNIYAAPGSIFIEADDGTTQAAIKAMIGNQLIVRDGAGISIINKSPFVLNVNDAVLKDNSKVVPIDGQLVTFEPGNIYLNPQR